MQPVARALTEQQKVATSRLAGLLVAGCYGRHHRCICLQASDEKYRAMQSRLERQEQRQVQMMQVLSKALQHLDMLQSLVGAQQQRCDGSVQGSCHADTQQMARAAVFAHVCWLFCMLGDCRAQLR
jgi:hypothetical protein